MLPKPLNGTIERPCASPFDAYHLAPTLTGVGADALDKPPLSCHTPGLDVSFLE